jgi:MoaA/NifB/PqqE/SkfB family radical SAM enzyme
MPALTRAPASGGATATLKLPAAICFRITRNCNARCSFCLAPPDGSHPEETVLASRIDWLLDRGVRSIQFCGGEPTIHPSLPQLLAYASGRGLKTSLCTNALAIPASLLPVLRLTDTAVRVSLHGDRAHHDAIVGSGCHQLTTGNVRRLLCAGVTTFIQTTVLAGGSWVVDWATDFCLQHGIRRLSILPFLPRGKGAEQRKEFALTEKERHALCDLVATGRHAMAGRLDLRLLDFNAKSIPVVEADGRVVLEGRTEAIDRVICRIS